MLCELMREMWRRREQSAWPAHLELISKLQVGGLSMAVCCCCRTRKGGWRCAGWRGRASAACREKLPTPSPPHLPAPAPVPARPQALLSLDSNGRQVLPPDAKTDLSRAYCLALAAAPLLDAARLGERSLTSRELVRLLVSSARSSAEVQQVRALGLGGRGPRALRGGQHAMAPTRRPPDPNCSIFQPTQPAPPQSTAVLALGNMHPGCHALVLGEAAGLQEDYLDRQMQRVGGGVGDWRRNPGPFERPPLLCGGPGAAAGTPRCMHPSTPPAHTPRPPPCPLAPQSITMPSVPGMGRRAVKKDDVRLAHAHLTRMLANNLPPGSLADNVVRAAWGCQPCRRYAILHPHPTLSFTRIPAAPLPPHTHTPTPTHPPTHTNTLLATPTPPSSCVTSWSSLCGRRRATSPPPPTCRQRCSSCATASAPSRASAASSWETRCRRPSLPRWVAPVARLGSGRRVPAGRARVPAAARARAGSCLALPRACPPTRPPNL